MAVTTHCRPPRGRTDGTHEGDEGVAGWVALAERSEFGIDIGIGIGDAIELDDATDGHDHADGHVDSDSDGASPFATRNGLLVRSDGLNTASADPYGLHTNRAVPLSRAFRSAHGSASPAATARTMASASFPPTRISISSTSLRLTGVAKACAFHAA